MWGQRRPAMVAGAEHGAGVLLPCPSCVTAAACSEKLQTKSCMSRFMLLFLDCGSECEWWSQLFRDRADEDTLKVSYSPGLRRVSEPCEGYNNCAVPSGNMVMNFPPCL